MTPDWEGMIRFATLSKNNELTRLRAELADVRAVLAAVDELGRGLTIGLSRATRECDALRAELAEARENEVFCNGCSGGEWTWMRRADEAEATIGRVRGVIACHSHDSAACDLLDDLDVALEGNGQG